MESTWEEQLWAEMEEKADPEKMIFAGAVITRLMRDVLRRLADARRLAAVRIVETGEFTVTGLAETIGAQPGTVSRLVEEGRRIRRRQQV